MLNLLFISDSPKVEQIKNMLQPVLDVTIDVVTDFDRGLKDVFEIRPTTVCIQDQIGGVAGESVARHIQMLLGSSAPAFILLHTANSKARTIKGVYEYLIDLSLSNEAVVEQLITTLKSLLGDQWERVYIKPGPVSVPPPSIAVPEELREDADRLADDFPAELETSGISAVVGTPLMAPVSKTVSEQSTSPGPTASPPPSGIHSGADESDRFQTMSDEIAELLIARSKKAAQDEGTAVPASTAVFREDPGRDDLPNPSALAGAQQLPDVSPLPAAPETSFGGTRTESPVIPASVKKDIHSYSSPAAAEFIINRYFAHAGKHSPENIMPPFDENCRSGTLFTRRSTIIALVCIACAAGGWYLFTHKTALYSLKLRLMPPSVVQPAAVSGQNQAPAPPPPIVSIPLPSFIPNEGHDFTYSVKNPGWERYVGNNTEFRVFRMSGRIQAVQVLSVSDAIIPESLVELVMKECTGSAEYLITSRTNKAGVLIESGSIKNVGEFMIYRKNGSVTAFVVSVN